jgi:hypothetical protein
MATEAFSVNDKIVFLGTTILDSHNDLCPNNVGGSKLSTVFIQLNVTGNTIKAIGPPGVTGATTITGIPVWRVGSVIGCAAKLNAAVNTGAVCKAWPTINGTTVPGLLCSIAVGATTKTAAIVKDTATAVLAAGDTLGCKFQTNTTITGSQDLAVTIIYEQ